MASSVRLVLRPTRAGLPVHFWCPEAASSRALPLIDSARNRFAKGSASLISGHRRNPRAALIKASPANGGNMPAAEDDGEDGVSLGTMKLPADTDVARFETLLFQWANSLCQGANLPLPMPLKVDKIPGGARLGFITIGDADTQVLVYIDCFVSPSTATDNAGPGPIFRAVRNGPSRAQPPPGEPRIMRSLLSALKKSVEIARV